MLVRNPGSIITIAKSTKAGLKLDTAAVKLYKTELNRTQMRQKNGDCANFLAIFALIL
jgi:hypothetical protein